MIEGHVVDKSLRAIAGARVQAKNIDAQFTQDVLTAPSGLFRLSVLPVGQYSLTVDAVHFARYTQQPIQVNVSQTLRVEVELDLATVRESVTVTGDAPLVDSSTNTLGKVVSGREVVDLPLNGRNFTQLGLPQTGVAPLTAGVATAGGSLRQGQAYAVNGMRPESNLYLLDGAQNMNRMDGGYALKIPVDAIAEFRILTQSAPPEYGGTNGATTSVVTRAGGNQLHGTLYEFLRNDKLDARNFFSSTAEPLNQNQFGGTVGGPIKKDRLFAFGYYEGFRNKQGYTNSATVPTPQQHNGDFSGLGVPLINFAAGGVPFPNNKIPAQAINPRRALAEIRRWFYADAAQHVPGHRAERVLRLRLHLPYERRDREPVAGRAGDVLPGARRFPPRLAHVEPQLPRAGRMAPDQPPHAQLWPSP